MKLHRLAVAVTTLVAAGLMSCADNKTKPTEEATSAANKASAAANKKLYDELIAISAPGGKQLPAPGQEEANWQSFNVGSASLRVPPDWKLHHQSGRAEDRIQEVGVHSPAGDIYVALRLVRDSDTNAQSPLGYAKNDYKDSIRRLAEEVTLGFQPMAIDGAVGKVEIMNVSGRDKNADGSPTFRMITWHGRWTQDNFVHSVEFNARFAQNRHDEITPLVSNILATVKTGGQPDDSFFFLFQSWMIWLGLASLGVVMWLLIRAQRNLQIVQAIMTAPAVPVNSSAQGLVKIVGQAHPGGDLPKGAVDPKLVWYARERQSTSYQGGNSQSSRSETPILLRDAAGECLIDPNLAEVVSSDKKSSYTEQGDYNSESIDLEFIRAGDAIFAVGILGDRTMRGYAAGQARRTLHPANKGVLLLSGRSEAETLQLFQDRRRACNFAAVLCVVLPCAGIAWYMVAAWQSANGLF